MHFDQMQIVQRVATEPETEGRLLREWLQEASLCARSPMTLSSTVPTGHLPNPMALLVAGCHSVLT